MILIDPGAKSVQIKHFEQENNHTQTIPKQNANAKINTYYNEKNTNRIISQDRVIKNQFASLMLK